MFSQSDTGFHSTLNGIIIITIECKKERRYLIENMRCVVVLLSHKKNLAVSYAFHFPGFNFGYITQCSLEHSLIRMRDCLIDDLHRVVCSTWIRDCVVAKTFQLGR